MVTIAFGDLYKGDGFSAVVEKPFALHPNVGDVGRDRGNLGCVTSRQKGQSSYGTRLCDIADA